MVLPLTEIIRESELGLCGSMTMAIRWAPGGKASCRSLKPATNLTQYFASIQGGEAMFSSIRFEASRSIKPSYGSASKTRLIP